MGKVKPQRFRCQLVLDAKGKRLIRCKNPAKHRLPDGTPLCAVHWRMSAEAKNPCSSKIMPFRKPRRLTPEIVGELLRIHSSCVHDQAGKCGLLTSLSSLTWELNQAANIANEEDKGFKRRDPMCAARPISDHDIERIVEGRRLADSMNEEPE
jgi:hypothetical protein